MGILNGDTFIDILKDRRKTSDIGWALKTWNVPPCRYSQHRSPQEIKLQMLQNAKIQSVIKEVSEEKGCSEEETIEEAKKILDEMAHTFQLRAIRFFGYTLSKFMKSVYGSILVNKRGVEKICNISTQYPILFLPTHRSYADFLLVSYVCFYFNLPLPVIAAGLDFLGLNRLSALLRAAGAFFIRRSFIGDKLYKEIFSEYVQSHIEGCEFPIEFFIEGTRSRTAKSLVPKLGMLQVILECFFSSKVPDITVVPISISYDRTLEESLYAYELLGVPKPKESTKGLIKARKVMSEFFGNVYVRFSDPISLKDYFRHYDRSVHNLHPRSLSVVNKEEQMMCRDLANYAIRMHQCNLLISPFPLICLVIGQPKLVKRGGVHFDHLIDIVFWLEELVRRTGATIYTGTTQAQTIEFHLRLHANIVQISQESIVSLKNCGAQKQAQANQVPRLSNDIVKCAIPAMFAYHYGNQALQLLVHMSMIALAWHSADCEYLAKESVFYRYEVLRKLLQREFVFERLTAQKDFDHALQSLKEENVLAMKESKIMSSHTAKEKMELLLSFLLPFLESYYVICQHLLNQQHEMETCCKKLAYECQSKIENAITEGTVHDHRCLSLDIINNCIAFLVCQGALNKSERNGQVIITPSHLALANILLDIEMFLPSLSGKFSPTNFSITPAKL